MPRVIRVIGEINEAAYERFSKKLRKFEEESDETVVVELCSFGGSDYDAIAFYGRMRNSYCLIRIEAYGQVLSAATLIFAAGDYRIIDSNAWFMVHDSTDKVTGQVASLSKHLKHMHKMENQWSTILSNRSRASKELWRELSMKETFITANELLELGLADEVLTGKDSPNVKSD